MSNGDFSTISDAISALKAGQIIIVCDDKHRENEGDFVVLGEAATPENINFMITHGRGLVCVSIEESRAKQLNFPLMVTDNTDRFRTQFTVSVDHIDTHTGISAFERAQTISKILDDASQLNDFRRPGHIFPLIAHPNGVIGRAGHTEACLDLAKLCNAKPCAVLCEILNADGTMARTQNLLQIAQQFNLKIITIADLINYRKLHDTLVTREVVATIPTPHGEFSIYGYSSILDNKEHLALVKGDLSKCDEHHIPTVRLHSECLTGDVFHSLRCDCGEQLDTALASIADSGLGVLLYLRQEGRGIGLFNKLRTYNLQDTGLDTAEANRKLGFAEDLRDYALAGQILRDLAITQVKLITNNPDKINGLTEYGIRVLERINLESTQHIHNQEYLETKRTKFGHML